MRYFFLSEEISNSSNASANADHYSKLDNEYQREVSEKIMGVMREKKKVDVSGYGNVIELRK
jgi:hypothetical protein